MKISISPFKYLPEAGVAGALAGTLAKIAGAVSWSWWVVLSPFWVMALFFMLGGIILVISDARKKRGQ